MARVLNKAIHGRPEGSVYIGRPRRWGNPFSIGKDGNREEVIQKYRLWLDEKPELKERMRRDLKDKDLVCFCYPQACHGDVILEVANSPEPTVATTPKMKLS